MFDIISRLHDISDDLNDREKDDLAESIDRIASFIFESYKFRVHRQKKSRGITKTRRRRTYKTHRSTVKRKQKVYRRKHKVQLRRRKRMKHFHRIF